MPGCFGGKQLVINNFEVCSYCQVSHSPHTNPNLLTMKPGSKNLFHTDICDDSLDITFWGIYDTDYFIAKGFQILGRNCT